MSFSRFLQAVGIGQVRVAGQLPDRILQHVGGSDVCGTFQPEDDGPTLIVVGDHVEMPPGFDSFALGRSVIHGRGLFCTLPVPEGKPVAVARVGGCRTVAGRLTNHSPLPNCRFEAAPDGLAMVARRTLTPGEELTVDYRQVASVNGWGLQPVPGEVVTTLRWRALALRRLGNPWARWCEASDDELTRAAERLLNRFGHLPSIDVTTAEKQSKEIK